MPSKTNGMNQFSPRSYEEYTIKLYAGPVAHHGPQLLGNGVKDRVHRMLS